MSTHHGVLLHVVFSTKFGSSCLGEPWRDELFAYMGGTARDHQAVVLLNVRLERKINRLTVAASGAENRESNPADSCSDLDE